jgi:hypothetical protein
MTLKRKSKFNFDADKMKEMVDKIQEDNDLYEISEESSQS